MIWQEKQENFAVYQFASKRFIFTQLGVATLPNLIKDTNYTIFIIGQAIERNDFQLHKAEALAQGFMREVSNPYAMLKLIVA
jgi:hypothetical protein